jgi:PPOX class probable F420-dependent enzyme
MEHRVGQGTPAPLSDRPKPSCARAARGRPRLSKAITTGRSGYACVVSGLEEFARLVAGDHGLVVVSTLRPDGTIQSSVVNAGVLPHPVTGVPVVGLVSRGDAHRLANLRARLRATVVVRSGWEWASAEGPAELAGPDDPMPGVDAERLRLLLREIFTAAGGTHDDFDAYDRVMATERRAAVLITPDRGFARPRG